MPLQKLPDAIGNLNALEVLNVSQTNVTELPDSICNLSELRIFNFEHSKAKDIPDSLRSFLMDNTNWSEKVDAGDRGVYIDIVVRKIGNDG